LDGFYFLTERHLPRNHHRLVSSSLISSTKTSKPSVWTVFIFLTKNIDKTFFWTIIYTDKKGKQIK